MSIEFADDDEDIFDTALLKRQKAKRDEYLARAAGYKDQGDNYNANNYRLLAIGATRMINMYEADLNGFSDTIPTGHGEL